MINLEGKLLKRAQRDVTIQAVEGGTLTQVQAARALGLSTRQLRRLQERVRTKGAAGLVHGNSGREPHNKTPSAVRDRVIALATTTYADHNFAHLKDELEREPEGIRLSDETLRLWLRPLGHGPPLRRTRPHRKRRTRKARLGELLFLDGSPHHWFGPQYPPCCLLLASDDATGQPLYGKFQPQEDRDGCFDVCYHVFAKFGLPCAFYLDRASQFTTTRHGGTHLNQSDDQLTQFERAMQELGIGLIFAHSPQARGRGERLNGSFQNRLVAEFVQRGIADCQAATRYLNTHFIHKYTKRFAKPPADPAPAWRALTPELELKRILCAKFPRVIARDNTVRLDGALFQLYPPRKLWKTEAQAWFDGSVHFWNPSCGELKARRLSHSPSAQVPSSRRT